VAVTTHPQPSHSQPGHTAAPVPQSRQIKLVAWVGTQPPGYQVAWMPKGWVVQGSTPFALVMAPPNDKDKNPDSYVGKLVVMWHARDAPAPPAAWANQPVNGRPGKFDVQGDTQILTFKNASGQWVVIQAPVSLGWDSRALATVWAGEARASHVWRAGCGCGGRRGGGGAGLPAGDEACRREPHGGSRRHIRV